MKARVLFLGGPLHRQWRVVDKQRLTLKFRLQTPYFFAHEDSYDQQRWGMVGHHTMSIAYVHESIFNRIRIVDRTRSGDVHARGHLEGPNGYLCDFRELINGPLEDQLDDLEDRQRDLLAMIQLPDVRGDDQVKEHAAIFADLLEEKGLSDAANPIRRAFGIENAREVSGG